MLELYFLYFIFYRIPKMMSSLAKERSRSVPGWSVLGITAWVGAAYRRAGFRHRLCDRSRSLGLA